MLFKDKARSSQLRLAVFAVIASLAGSSFYYQARAAGNTANTTATAIAHMLIPIAIARTDHLEFGETYDGDSLLTLAANSTETGSGVARRRAAEFEITGEGAHSFSFTLSAATVTMTTGLGDTAVKQMIVNNFTASPAFSGGVTGSTTLSGSAGSSGSRTIYIGGDRAAPIASQVTGSYASPNFTMTVTYN